MRARLAILAIGAFALDGCSFVPNVYPRLDEARDAHRKAAADPGVRLYAGAELKSAGEVLERALVARDTLDDPAVVDHLAYLARQRVAISIEVAKGKALQREALDRQRAARIAARR